MCGIIAAISVSCGENDAEFPRKPIKAIVPFKEGGASTATARPIQRAIVEDTSISEQPLAVIPMDGAGGSVGSLRVKTAKPDGYTILNLHDGIITQKYVEGGTDYGPEAFTPIATTCRSGSVVCVSPASRFKSLQQLLDEAAANPESVKFGSNYGAPSHFVALLLAREREGLKFSYPPMKGGADRFEHLLEGRIDATMFSVSEFKQFSERGIEAIAYLGEKRHPNMPDTPTAKEQGVDLVWDITQMWWAPLGTPEDRVAKIAAMLKAAVESDSVKERFEQLNVEPLFIEGEELRQLIEQKESMIASLEVESNSIKAPPLMTMVLIAVVGLFAALIIFAKPKDPEKLPLKSTAMMAAGLIVFVAILMLRILPFWIPAAAATVVLALILAPDRKSKITASSIAAVLTIAVYIVFTHIFIVDLP
ncbi:MAG: tripartite tricarboxylate transporter substrate binding protein [Verrucomicrobiota bacterium]